MAGGRFSLLVLNGACHPETGDCLRGGLIVILNAVKDLSFSNPV